MVKPCRIAGLLALAALFLPCLAIAHVERMTVPELAAASPHIVVAVVESRQSRWNEQHTLLVTDYVLRVEERLRGEAPDRVSITVPGGALGRFSDETCLTVHLEPGSRYLLFLSRLDEPGLVPVTGAWQGMFRELPGHLAALGESREPLVLQSRPVRFADLVAAVRPLAADAGPPGQDLAPRGPSCFDPEIAAASRRSPGCGAPVARRGRARDRRDRR